VQVDNKNIVALIHGRTFIQLEKGEDGIFRKEYEIPNNISEMSIGIANSEKGSYENTVKYTVK
jgi:hypothetical protein